MVLSAPSSIDHLGYSFRSQRCGRKIPLSFEEASTEHHEPVKTLLRELIDRGLSYDQGLLFVTDGARDLHKAIQEIFSGYGLIQRCQCN